jgi:hypothetical protein
VESNDCFVVVLEGRRNDPETWRRSEERNRFDPVIDGIMLTDRAAVSANRMPNWSSLYAE